MNCLNSQIILHFLVIVFFYSFCINSDQVYENKNIPRSNRSNRKKSLVSRIYTTNVSAYDMETSNQKEICKWLRGLKHHAKLCRNRKGLPELLQETKHLARTSCKMQFQYDHWNCSSTNMKKFFKHIYRETAFMYSLATSTFMYLVARACAQGKLANCKCASHGKSDNMTWQWGGCGDNTHHAKSLTKNFFQLKRKGNDWRGNEILKHNSEMGVRVVLEKEEKVCKCHGISGSCSLQICFKRLKNFNEISHTLKEHYYKALQLESQNTIDKLRKHRKRGQLMFLDASPNFCSSTIGRRCRDVDNCATLCCGRGYVTSTEITTERCKCKWSNVTAYQLQCQVCEIKNEVYHCR